MSRFWTPGPTTAPAPLNPLAPSCSRRAASGLRPTSRAATLLALALATVSAAGPLGAQDHKRKIPVLDKLSSSPSRQAFSGKVLSFDAERSLLNVNTVQGSNTEIFPVKKARVVTAAGEKLKLSALTPGTDVIIYFEQKGDQRSVKDIVVLALAPGEPKKSPPPS